MNNPVELWGFQSCLSSHNATGLTFRNSISFGRGVKTWAAKYRFLSLRNIRVVFWDLGKGSGYRDHAINRTVRGSNRDRRKTFSPHWIFQTGSGAHSPSYANGILMVFWPCIMNWLYINYQLWWTDYYLFIKYYFPLHVSSLKYSSSGGHSCTHAAYGTVTLYESSHSSCVPTALTDWLYNRDGVCLLRGTNWIFKCNRD